MFSILFFALGYITFSIRFFPVSAVTVLPTSKAAFPTSFAAEEATV